MNASDHQIETVPVSTSLKPSDARVWMITIAIVAVSALATVFLWSTLRTPETAVSKKVSATSASELPTILTVDSAEQKESHLTVVPVLESAPAQDISIPGTVEPDQERLQQVTPLVSGRVEKINVALGDHVNAGDLLVAIDSPQVAELHGKLHEARTKLALAEQNMTRVTQAANRVSVLKSKATLTEADQTLKRTQQLLAEGIMAKKDVVAAEAEYDRAAADYNFQKNISLNREVAEAKAELSMARTESEHIIDALRALDATLPEEKTERRHDISAIQLRAPVTGTIIERFVNPGAGFEAGKPLLTVADTSHLWVIASVPDSMLSRISVGMPSKVIFENRTIMGTVSYIDPRLNEDTRSGRVRIEISNKDHRIKVGSFVQVVFSPADSITGTFVPTDAVQTIDDRTVVFVEKANGQFEPKTVVTGSQIGTLTAIKSGLTATDRVVTKGSFLLKSKLLKNQLGEETQ